MTKGVFQVAARRFRVYSPDADILGWNEDDLWVSSREAAAELREHAAREVRELRKKWAELEAKKARGEKVDPDDFLRLLL
jgi:hypothetical protein